MRARVSRRQRDLLLEILHQELRGNGCMACWRTIAVAAALSNCQGNPLLHSQLLGIKLGERALLLIG
eukprot:840231-Pleurochrysis_carterae.AAC.3